MEPRRPQSSQTTVSVQFDEPDSEQMIKFGVAECIETKTITTTTTTKRSFPPLRVRETRPLSSLDVKEFPLARKPTPPELAHVTFDADEYLPWTAGFDCSDFQNAQRSTSDSSTQTSKAGTIPTSDSPSRSSCPPRRLYALPSQSSPRQTHKPPSRSVSPVAKNLIKKTTYRSRVTSQTPFPNNVSDRLRHLASHPPTDSNTNAGTRPRGLLPVNLDAPEEYPGLTNKALRRRRSIVDSFETPQSESSQPQSFFDAATSPTGSDAHTVYSAVATPPVTDADIEPEPSVEADEDSIQQIRATHHPRPINTLVTQDASLPSPGLSPTLQATHLPTTTHDDSDVPGEDGSMDAVENRVGTEIDGLQTSGHGDSMTGSRFRQASLPTLMDSRSMLETFDAMPTDMQTAFMYQFLRRCSRKTLNVVANVVNPALRCNIIQYLPLELTLHTLSFLDHRDLCRAAQVCKQWRRIVDSNETGWKELFDRDGFVLSTGELDRAIREGWGWQDPVGLEGCELDLSLQNRLTSTESELRSAPKPELPIQKLRSSKRKRGLTSFTSDRSKRRASNQDNVKDERASAGSKALRSEGPISAANAAALAVPDPKIGLPSLSNLHLFKSLYRRHYMFRKSWTSGKVKPGHVAFAAHPRHVITCLQFDDDKIITGSDDMLIHVYDTKTGKLRRRLEGHEGGVWALQYEGNTLVSGSTDRSVRVWDIEKGLCTQVFYGHTSTVRCLQILMPAKIRSGKGEVMMPAKPLIITGSRDSQLRVWRLPEAGSRRYIQTGPPANDADCPYFIRTLQGHGHSVRAIAAHGDTLVSGSYDNTVRVWRISTGETVHVLQGHSQKVYSVVLDVERNRCISGSMDSFVKIWDLETGTCLHTLEGHSLLVGLLDLRDQRLVSAAADSTLRIWDPESGRCQATLTAHTGAITCFQHDGRKVISGSDRTLKMWDARTGECIEDLLTDLSGVWQVKFDERRCVAAVQRDSLTYVEILDFGAIRDGKKPEELGRRILLNAPEVQQIIEEDN
ncbi:WD40 repeat-like protein [Poronia punctata]|nr:WD40 repeat-like protein [Poronia punctata]